MIVKDFIKLLQKMNPEEDLYLSINGTDIISELEIQIIDDYIIQEADQYIIDKKKCINISTIDLVQIAEMSNGKLDNIFVENKDVLSNVIDVYKNAAINSKLYEPYIIVNLILPLLEHKKIVQIDNNLFYIDKVNGTYAELTLTEKKAIINSQLFKRIDGEEIVWQIEK